MQRQHKNSFFARESLQVGDQDFQIFRLTTLEDSGFTNISKLPFSIRILLENVLRNEDGRLVTEKDAKNLAGYDAKDVRPQEIPYMPARVVMQDFTGVPAVVDLAAMRDAMTKFGGDPAKINQGVRETRADGPRFLRSARQDRPGRNQRQLQGEVPHRGQGRAGVVHPGHGGQGRPGVRPEHRQDQAHGRR